MMRSSYTDNRAPKVAYDRPKLTVYGSVRNLTGGTGGTAGDGAVNMTMIGL